MLSPISAPRAADRGQVAGRVGVVALLTLPGLLTLYLGFNSGGFFVDVTGLAAVVLALALAVRITLAERPFAGVSGPVVVAAGALALYAVLALVSASWSGSPARALLEFDRALVYLLVLVLLGSLSVTPERLAWALRAFALAAVAVCLAGLVSRVAPDVLPTATDVATERLSYPVSYWNALGLLAAIGMIVCLHLTSERRSPGSVRVAGAAAVPALAATLLLTFSRGAIGVAIVGLLAYAVLARSRGTVFGLVATVPPAALAVVAAYRAELLADADFTTPAAISQGHDLAVLILLAVLLAGGLRAILGFAEVRLDRALRGRSGRLNPRRAGLVLVVTAALAGCALAVALDVPERVERQYEAFVAGASSPAETRARLTSASNNGRLGQWRVALEAFRGAPLAGEGAGTFQVIWTRARDDDLNVVDGHSLYLETLAELGFVGLALLVTALLTIMGALAVRTRGPNRGLYAALLASLLAWAIHAAADWDWEMPVVTTWAFALGGLAIAAPSGTPRSREPASLTRIVAALGCLLLAVTPALAALSQQALDRSVAAYRQGDCTASADAALASISYLSVRPQPFELLSYCNVRAGLPALAIKSMGKARARDPRNWEYEYGLALVRGVAGLDPRPQAARALLANPRSQLARKAALDFGTTDSPREWRRRALEARLPIAP